MSMERLKAILRPIYVPLVAKARFLCLRLLQPLCIMSAEATIDYIMKHNCSVARYGDGEFNITLHDYGVVFQGYNPNLSHRLRKVLATTDERVLICLPYSLSNQRGMNEHAQNFWREWAFQNYTTLAAFLYKSRGARALYGDADITRPYKNWKRAEHAERVFAKLKQLWCAKDILIVEGEQTRLGVGNDLLSNASTIKRVLCPPKNAFNCYETIVGAVLKHWNGELVLIALGPAATVLAADLTEHGIQALDVGHMDIEYEWMLRRSTEKEQIPGKYTNEANNDELIGECVDPLYLSQIVCRISE